MAVTHGRMDLDVVAHRNPLPYLIGLSADVAVPNSRCADTHDDTPLRVGVPLQQDTGLLYADANPRALRFVYDWLRVQRHYRCAGPPGHMCRGGCNINGSAAVRKANPGKLRSYVCLAVNAAPLPVRWPASAVLHQKKMSKHADNWKAGCCTQRPAQTSCSSLQGSARRGVTVLLGRSLLHFADKE